MSAPEQLPNTPERLSLPLATEPCPGCDQIPGTDHDEECVVAEHVAMVVDETAKAWHQPEECELCLSERSIHSICRCAACCRHLIIEVSLLDAQREPKIRERGSTIYTSAILTGTGKYEIEGWLLNGPPGGPCVFLDQATNLCTIHDTRPLCCRLFNCDRTAEGKDLDKGKWGYREEDDEEV